MLVQTNVGWTTVLWEDHQHAGSGVQFIADSKQTNKCCYDGLGYVLEVQNCGLTATECWSQTAGDELGPAIEVLVYGPVLLVKTQRQILNYFLLDQCQILLGF